MASRTTNEHLDAIYAEHGYLTPDLLVELAKPKEHPLHGVIFDKPEREAAASYYRSRAHEVITSYRISYATPAGGIADIRKYHAVRADGPSEYVYKSAEDVAGDPVQFEIVLRDMERQWRQLYNRYSQFQEFAVMVRASFEGEPDATQAA